MRRGPNLPGYRAAEDQGVTVPFKGRCFAAERKPPWPVGHVSQGIALAGFLGGHRLGGSGRRGLSSQARGPEVRGPATSVSPEASPLGVQTAIFFLCPRMAVPPRHPLGV